MKNAAHWNRESNYRVNEVSSKQLPERAVATDGGVYTCISWEFDVRSDGVLANYRRNQ